MLKGAAED